MEVVRLTRLEALDDAELLTASTQAEHASRAFGVFYRRHDALVLGYLRRRLPDAELAADLAAETFAAALEAAPRFQRVRSKDGSAVAWLSTIAHRQLLDAVRHDQVGDRVRRRLQLLEPLGLEDDALARVDELASVPEQLLTELPDTQREAVLARVVDERPYADIAEQMRCSELVVRRRVSRGLARLRTELSKENA